MSKIKPLLIPVIILVFLMTFTGSAQAAIPSQNLIDPLRGGGVITAGDPPVANPDTYGTNEDTLLEVAAPGVLGNDTDTEADPLTAVLVSDVSFGTLSLNSDGSFTYTPGANFNGTDSFTYQAYDGTAYSAEATVEITVSAVNDVPVAVNDSHSTAEDTQLVVNSPGVLTNDSDVDGETLTAVSANAPVHGDLTLNANGSFTYIPGPNYHGTDSFTYQAYDGIAYSTEATVSITITSVNDAPLAVNDEYSTAEDTLLTVLLPGVLVNDSDAEGDTLSAVLVDDVAYGTLTLDPNGSFTYLPDANYAGADSFTYRASDGTETSNLATVSITVTPVNDAPLAVNDSYSTPEDTQLVVNAPGILGNDTDVDSDILTAVWAEDPAHGLLTLNADGSFTYTPDTGYTGADSFNYKADDGTTQSAPATVNINVSEVNSAPVADAQTVTTSEDTAKGITLTGSDADGDTLTYSVVANPSHGTLSGTVPNLTYTPAANYNGSDSFTFKVNDGTVDSNIATVSITITAVNDAPVANAQSVTTDEDTAKAITLTGSDVDGDDLDFTIVADPSFGTLSGTAPDLTYTPDPGFNGPDSFTFKVNDGLLDSPAATVSITVILDEPLLTYLPLIMRSPEFGIPPAPFTKTSPFDGAIYQLPTPTLSWAATKQVTHYEYCYDKTNDSACSNWINAGIATSVTLPTLSLNTTYYWQVRAWNGTVGPVYADGALIEFWSFTTSPVYPPPNTILNGGFELGDRDWTQYSSHGYPLIIDSRLSSLPHPPHSGYWLAWLGGVTGEISSVSQTVVIPAGRSILHYWFYSGSSYACDKDYFKVYAGSDVLYSQTICEDTMTGAWVHKVLDLTLYAGSIKTLKFELSTSNSTYSNVLLDDISLEATTSLAPGLDMVGLENSSVDLKWLFIKKEGGE